MDKVGTIQVLISQLAEVIHRVEMLDTEEEISTAGVELLIQDLEYELTPEDYFFKADNG